MRGPASRPAAYLSYCSACLLPNLTALFALPAAAIPALEALSKSLSDAERGAFRQQLLARAAAAQDPCFHDALYATLVQLR